MQGSGAEARDVAQKYADAASIGVKIKKLPSTDTLAAYPPLLNKYVPQLDASSLSDVKRSLSEAVALENEAATKFNAGAKVASDLLTSAFTKGSIAEGVVESSTGDEWGTYDLLSKQAAESYGAGLKLAATTDTQLRDASRQINRVNLEQFPQLKKEVIPLVEGQALLKPVGALGKQAETSARAASSKLNTAKNQWDEARKAFIAAEKAEIEAARIYNDAAKLGEEEARIFGETL